MWLLCRLLCWLWPCIVDQRYLGRIWDRQCDTNYVFLGIGGVYAYALMLDQVCLRCSVEVEHGTCDGGRVPFLTLSSV